MTTCRNDCTSEQDWPPGFGGNIVDWPGTPTLVSERHIRVEKFVHGDELVVRAELPGVDPVRDVSIRLADHTMLLSAKRRRPDGGRADPHDNRSDGRLSRVVGLPPGTVGKYTTTYSAGVLVIRLPIAPSLTEVEAEAGLDGSLVDAA